MARLLCLAVLLVAAASSASAQGAAPDAAAQLHRGRVKVWLGTALIVAGAVAVPVTATSTNSDRTAPNGKATIGGLALASAGGVLIWSGLHD